MNHTDEALCNVFPGLKAEIILLSSYQFACTQTAQADVSSRVYF